MSGGGLTVADLNSIVMESRAQVEEWEAQFWEEWNEPLRMIELTVALLSMPESERAALAEADPVMYARIKANVDRLARKTKQKGY